MVITTITNDSDEYAKEVAAKLEQNNFRVKLDLTAEKIGYKIREYSLKKIPYILAIGKNEAQNNSVSVRKLGEEGQKTYGLEEFIAAMKIEKAN